MTCVDYPIQNQCLPDLDFEERDLSSLSDKMTSFRRTRCLNLRTSINLCPNRTCKCNGKFYVCPKRSSSLNSLSATINVDDLISVLSETISSGSTDGIQTICTTLVSLAEQSPKTVTTIMGNADVQEAFVTFLDESSNLQNTKTVLDTLSAVLKCCPQVLESFTDVGLTSQLLFLLSSEDEDIIASAINLVGAICYEDGYTRDAIICLGIHTTLIEIAGNNRGSDIAYYACESLRIIYGNPSPIDTEVIRSSTQPIVELIEGQTEPVVNDLLSILVDMSSKQPSVVFTLSKLGFYNVICDYIRNPQLTEVALKLAGNMSVSQPSQIRILLDHGLMEIIVSLISTEYAADAFWVLSNMLESLPEVILDVIDESFIEATVQVAEDAPFDAKREASFFLSTVVVFGGNDKIESFFNERIFGIISDVLGCGVQSVEMRCIDALVAFLVYSQSAGKTEEFNQLIVDSDLEDRLKEFDQDSSIIGQRARYILTQLNN